MAEPRHPFTYGDYRAFWIARLATTIAQNGMVVVIGWQVYDIARSGGMTPREAALQLGLIGIAQFLPLFLLTLIVGWTADRVDRRWIARGAVTLEAGCAATLAVLAATDSTTLPWLFFIAALLGVARAFAGPALSALAPNLVPREVLPTAIALSSIAWQTGAIIGPAAGGYLYAHSHWLPYTVSGGLFATACLCLFLIRPVARVAIDRSVNPWRQMIDGLAYVRQNRLVLGAISLDLFAVLLGGATAMLPIFARDVLHVGAEGLGHLRAAPAAGAAAVALLFAFRPLKHDVGLKMLAAVVVFGACTVGFGLSRSIPLSLACLAVLGAADMLSVYVRSSLIQLYTPDAMRGRVAAVSTLFVSASNELGEAESGFLAAAIGPVAAVVGGGIGAILVTLAWARWFPELKRARTFDPPAGIDGPVQEKAA
ncbi:MFS transporter [Sphingomonas jatrophae]|uniref:Predicted arabinose efflux permease, MFS family n=1 Tax=Sphingomonas jatrophae TaxID=1166337 RepID=A0A1I6JXC5_9SPHN|nr:MFS transporter [Sphingomonas jatrophae]SFR83180.1 Predicted arabinose efflux permease, MFS family [Sphingomonas jatrophae]